MVKLVAKVSSTVPTLDVPRGIVRTGSGRGLPFRSRRRGANNEAHAHCNGPPPKKLRQKATRRVWGALSSGAGPISTVAHSLATASTTHAPEESAYAQARRDQRVAMQAEQVAGLSVTQAELLKYTDETRYFKFEQTQHALTFHYCMLINGRLNHTQP